MPKTSSGLVEYAKKQLGKPYWYGTFGQKSSASLYKQKKAQYPGYYTATDYSSQYGVKVHDCIGLIKGYVWCDSPTDMNPKYADGMPDINEAMLYDRATKKGSIGSMPDIPGICVLLNGHIGVYIGDGYVVEARGHAYGVVKTKLKDRPWTKWCKCPYIEYDTEKTENKKPTTKTEKPKKTTTSKKVDPAQDFSKTLAGTYTVTASALNVRKGAGTDKDVLVIIPRGTKVQNYGYYSTVSKVKWLYVQFTYRNKTYTGFISSKYVEKR
jgi:hypothetical protein